MTSKTLEMTVEASAALFQALSDPIRLRLLDELRDGQRCACELLEAVPGSVKPNLLSYHLRVLRDAGLVTATRRGRWIDYDLAPGVPEKVHCSLPEGLRW